MTGSRMAKKSPTRAQIKKALTQVERDTLVSLVADLHGLGKENRAFIDARLGLTAHPLAPFKKRIEEALFPDIIRGHPIRISAARKALSDYRRAIGDPEGVLDLLVHYVECGTRMTVEYGDIDEGFYDSLESVFDEAVTKVEASPPELVGRFLPRLRSVVQSARGIGWGYHDFLRDRLHESFSDD